MIEDARPGEDDGMDVDPVGMEESDDVVGNESRGSEDADEEAEEEAERQRPLRDPGQPTQEMIDEHNLSHIPFRPWCAACIRGKAKDDPSRKLKGVWAESLVPRVRLDYAFLTECEGPTCVPCQPAEPGAYDDVAEPQQTYYSAVTRMDRQVGRILDAVKSAGIDDRTLILFSSDNGPTHDRKSAFKDLPMGGVGGADLA